MRRQLPRLALLFLIVAVVPGVSPAENATIHLDRIRAEILDRDAFEQLPGLGLRSKQEKLCRKAFEKAESLLAKDTATLAEDAKALASSDRPTPRS